MAPYFVRKLLALPAVLLGVSLAVFVLVRALPGDPARLIAGPEATQQAVDDLRVRLGLDQTLLSQYLLFLHQALHGNFGTSMRSGLPVLRQVLEGFPNTAALALCAYTLAVLVGIPAGVLAARYRGRWPDRTVMIAATMCASTANFWLAMVGMNLFAVQLQWLPLMGAESWKSIIMPAVALGLLPTAVVARMMRSSMVEVLAQDYIRTARAKGLGLPLVYWRHALRNALVPVTTVVGMNFGSILGGAVVTENVFGWPGVGRLLVDAIANRDYPLIQLLVLVAVTSVVLMNLLADFIVSLLDPRIRYE